MRKNPGRKLRRQNERIENNRAYPDGTKFENDGIKKTQKYADGRQKRYAAQVHSDSDYTTINKINQLKRSK